MVSLYIWYHRYLSIRYYFIGTYVLMVPEVLKNHNGKEHEVTGLNRCIICNSTEERDTFERDGINTQPIEYWVITDQGETVCNRCNDSIKEALVEFEQDE